MRGRPAAWVVAAALLAALALQTARFADRVRASVALKQGEALSLFAPQAGERGTALLRASLLTLRRAQAWDRVEVGIPLAIGSTYLLLGSPQAAIEAYEEALALEPRPEIYLNLGRAQLAAGREDEARLSFERAIALHPYLWREVPEGFRPRAQPGPRAD